MRRFEQIQSKLGLLSESRVGPITFKGIEQSPFTKQVDDDLTLDIQINLNGVLNFSALAHSSLT